MYELKALQPQFDIKLPTCMYSMKNVSLAEDAPESGSSSCYSEIGLRQEKVLNQLFDLQKQLAEIRSTLGLCQKDVQHTQQRNVETPHDIVVNGNPKFIPYGLLALKNAWRDSFAIDVKTFTHSSLPDIGAEARSFENQLQQVPVDVTKPKVNLTLIWKQCEHTEMISSPAMYVPIYGEVNILRFLGRVGPAEYRYEDTPFCNEIDAVLDICYQLLRSSTSKGREKLIHSLNQQLQKRQFFGGDQISIADIGVYSSLKRIPKSMAKDLSPALATWQKRVQLVTQV